MLAPQRQAHLPRVPNGFQRVPTQCTFHNVCWRLSPKHIYHGFRTGSRGFRGSAFFTRMEQKRLTKRSQTPTQSECILQDLNDSNKRIRSETIEISPMWAVADKEYDFGIDRILKYDSRRYSWSGQTRPRPRPSRPLRRPQQPVVYFRRNLSQN